MLKVMVVKEYLLVINSGIYIEVYVVEGIVEMFELLIEKVDVVIDVIDNFEICMLINDLV